MSLGLTTKKSPTVWEKVNQGNLEADARVRLEIVPDAVSRSEAGASKYLREHFSPSATGWWT